MRTILVLALLCSMAHAQSPGMWTWMSGASSGLSPGSFGTYRVPSASNAPGARYQAAFWTDLNGDFWLFGGHMSGLLRNDLWRYDVDSGLWTWMHGSNLFGQPPVVGTLGVPAPANTPGGRAWGSVAWTGADGNLWLFGGSGEGTSGPALLADLWRFDVITLEWTCMKGPTGSAPGDFGTLGVPAATNYPPGRAELTAGWKDANGDLWLYGGRDQSDLWKYEVATNNWVWMHGGTGILDPAVYGTLGVPSPANTPGTRWAYGEWSDGCGRFYLFGGKMELDASQKNDLWRFDSGTNEWTWIGGPTVESDMGNPGVQCLPAASNLPHCRMEHGAQWIDHEGGLWMFGGLGIATYLDDLWHYNFETNEFTWIHGNPVSGISTLPSYGTLGIASATNTPGGRVGACAWTDRLGRLWLFGGINGSGQNNDLWMYEPDTSCVPDMSPLQAACWVDSTDRCNGVFVFHDTTSGPHSLVWHFGDGSSSTSPDVVHSYATPGTYVVMLEVTQSCHTSTHFVTLTAPGLSPAPDTAICEGSHADLNCGLVPPCPACLAVWSTGDTSTTISVTAAGNYSVSINAYGCVFVDTITVTVAPNPVVDLGPDTTLCGDTSLVLVAGACAGCASLWSTGSAASSIAVSTTGTYSVNVHDTTLGCSASDSILVVFITAPYLPLSRDFCQGEPASLDAGPGFDAYLWSTGDSTSSVSVSTWVLGSSTYAVTVTQGPCTFTPSCVVTVHALPAALLPSDTLLCPGESLLLDPDPGGVNGGASYLWSTGDTIAALWVSTAGAYEVMVTSPEGCLASDTALVHSMAPLDLGPDLLLCQLGEHILDAGHAGATFVWSNGDTIATVRPDQPGDWWVLVQDGPCLLQDTVKVEAVTNGGLLTLPNVFTPNADGLYDDFGASGEATFYDLQVYDRWGTLMFQSDEMATRWNGTFHGSPAPEGVYFCLLTYRSACDGDQLVQVTRNVTLVR